MKETVITDVQEKIAYKIEIIGSECAVSLDAPMKNMMLLVNEMENLLICL